MYERIDKNKGNKSQFVAKTQKKGGSQSTFQLVDDRSEAVVQRKLKEMANNSPETMQLKSFQSMANKSSQTKQVAQFQDIVNNSSSRQQPTIQKKEKNTGLPDNLKTGIENLSGYAMYDVKVHYNSDKPAQLQAHAYAQGTDIHLAPGQEKHLPHEAWHVVQQKQGRVKPTMQMKGKVNVNDDDGLEKEAEVMGGKAFQFVDNRPEAKIHRKQQLMDNNSFRSKQLKNNTSVSHNSELKVIQAMFPRRKVPYKSDDAREAREWRMEDRNIKGRNIATLYYTVLADSKTMATSEHSQGKHSEKLIMEELISLYGKDYKTKLSFQTLFTERDACGDDYHNCRTNIHEWFPGVKVTYNADYPSEGDVSDDSASGSDSESKRTHRRLKAKKRRAKGTAKVKRADKFAGSAASVDWESFEDSADDM